MKKYEVTLIFKDIEAKNKTEAVKFVSWALKKNEILADKVSVKLKTKGKKG